MFKYGLQDVSDIDNDRTEYFWSKALSIIMGHSAPTGYTIWLYHVQIHKEWLWIWCA